MCLGVGVSLCVYVCVMCLPEYVFVCVCWRGRGGGFHVSVMLRICERVHVHAGAS